MNRCVIISASPEADPARIREFLLPSDDSVAADGGWRLAKVLGLHPLAMIADFDSQSEAEFDHSVPLVRFSPIKDCTDTQAAVEYAWERGYRDYLLVGCCGGRLDHTYANWMTMARIVRGGGSVRSIGDHEVITLVSPGQYTIPYEPDTRLSLLPFGGDVTGLTLENVYYPLRNGTLTIDTPLGISNEFLKNSEENAAPDAKISFKCGYLLIFLSRD